LARDLDRVLALERDRDGRARRHELHQVAVERALLVDLVVLLEQRFRELAHLEADDLEALLLEAADDLAGETALDTVGFEEDERAFEHGLRLELFDPWSGGARCRQGRR